MFEIKEERKMPFYNLEAFFFNKNAIHFKCDKINIATLTEATHIRQYLRDT